VKHKTTLSTNMDGLVILMIVLIVLGMPSLDAYRESQNRGMTDLHNNDSMPSNTIIAYRKRKGVLKPIKLRGNAPIQPVTDYDK